MKTASAVTIALLLAACAGPMGAGSGEVAEYSAAAAQLSESVTAYEDVADAAPTAEACRAAVREHATAMERALERMREMAARMDDRMASMGRAMHADMACGTTAIREEVLRHREAACASTDPEANRVEARRHVATMRELTDHMRLRGEEMATMMSAGMGRGGAMMHGGPPAPGDGWMTPDGHVMPWDHAIPGCGAATASAGE
jgi:hypothetical protein